MDASQTAVLILAVLVLSFAACLMAVVVMVMKFVRDASDKLLAVLSPVSMDAVNQGRPEVINAGSHQRPQRERTFTDDSGPVFPGGAPPGFDERFVPPGMAPDRDDA